MRERIRLHLSYANVMVTILAFIVLGGMSYAATGGNFILGKSNSASTSSSLTAPVSGKALQLTNTSTGAGATALGLNVAGGHPPFTVNSGTKVASLNADKLDGKDSTAFLQKGTGAVGPTDLSHSIPAVKVTRSNDWSIPGTSTLTKLPFDQEIYDTANMHQNVGEDIDRLIAPVAGIYMVTAHVRWEPNSTGVRQISIQRTFNGGAAAEIIARDVLPGTVADTLNVATPVKLAQGDYVRTLAFNDSGGSLNVLKNAPSPEMSLTWLAPGP